MTLDPNDALRMVRFAEAVRRSGKSRTSIYRDIAAGRMPAPVRIGPRAVGWRSDEYDAWLRSLCDRGGRRPA